MFQDYHSAFAIYENIRVHKKITLYISLDCKSV